MGAETAISWTDSTFNPWWGCTKVSPGCSHCYAETFAKRTGHQVWGEAGERRIFGDAHWNEPRKWNRDAAAAKKRRRVFCASMADVFEDHPIAKQERPRLWKLIDETPWLDWLLLTKRPENLWKMMPPPQFSSAPSWLQPNVWLGVTAENQEMADKRIPLLLKMPAVVHFVSAEPLLGPLDLSRHLRCPRDTNHDGDCDRHPQGCPRVDWVIVGGESGGKARPFDLEWAEDIVRQCLDAGVAPFVKQLGAMPVTDVEPTGNFRTQDGKREMEMKATRLRLADRKGGDISEFPPSLQVRRFPEVRTP